MPDGFLGRWSKRKLDAKEGKPVQEEPPAPAIEPPVGIPVEAGIQTPAQADAPPPLTLEEAQALTAESDFRPFAARGVAPDVKNAAMKKLFSDPHYNVMDRLDTYIDDYSQPDPIPMKMLRKLASAKFLGLFDAEEKAEAEEAARLAREAADNPTNQTVAQSVTPPVVVPAVFSDDDPDLRLQQDHASPGNNPGGGAA